MAKSRVSAIVLMETALASRNRTAFRCRRWRGADSILIISTIRFGVVCEYPLRNVQGLASDLYSAL